jgi:anti-sigma regulatory factor (Ser/Thr protein kinase)
VEAAVTSAVEHGVAGHALSGQARSGDRGVFLEYRDGVLAAVIDGLGHGDEAANAAEAAARVLTSMPDAPVEDLVTRCHEALRGTRGVAMSIASLDLAHATLTWLGVGNVDGVLARAIKGGAGNDEGIIAAGGIVGYRMPTLRARRIALQPGDTLVLASDGVKHGFRAEILPVRDAQQVADHILANWAKASDDACVLVARYRGSAHDGSRVDVDGEAGVAQARIRTRDRARSLGFQPADIEALATAVSELARNIVDHAVTGEITFVPVHDERRTGLSVRARDRGPGIGDVQRALEDDFSTGGGLGCGLSAARRFVDDMRVETEVGAGTVITITKWLR